MTEQRIPFVKVQLDEDDIAAVEAVLRSGWLTTASQVKALEQELCEYKGSPGSSCEYMPIDRITALEVFVLTQ